MTIVSFNVVFVWLLVIHSLACLLYRYVLKDLLALYHFCKPLLTEKVLVKSPARRQSFELWSNHRGDDFARSLIFLHCTIQRVHWSELLIAFLSDLSRICSSFYFSTAANPHVSRTWVFLPAIFLSPPLSDQGRWSDPTRTVKAPNEPIGPIKRWRIVPKQTQSRSVTWGIKSKNVTKSKEFCNWWHCCRR